MKRMNKLLSALLVITIAMMMMTSVALAEVMAVFTVTSDVSTVKAGDTFTVNVNLTENKTVGGITLYADYDKETFTLTNLDISKTEIGNVGDWGVGVKKGIMMYSPLGTMTDTGLVGTMTFTVNENATAGEYTIGLKNLQILDENVSDIDGEAIPMTITVVDESAEVAVESVVISGEVSELTVGDTTTLTATVSPEDATDKSVSWTSSDENVATVDAAGKVSAVAAGTATITATAGSKSAIYAVTVKEEEARINEDHADMNVSAETVAEGDEVKVLLSIENDADSASKYNSYEFRVSYDSTLLTYVGLQCDETQCAAVQKDGTLVINGYGEDKTVSEDAFVTLTFKANEVTETTTTAVKLTNAYRDTSDVAISQDIDEIPVETESVNITIEDQKKTYSVNFSETVKVNGENVDKVQVTEGESVTFNVIDKTGMDVAVSGATKNDDGSYTVTPTTDTTVTITYTAKTYDVTIEGTGAGDVTKSADKATYGQAYAFTLKKDSGYDYTVTVKVDGKTVSTTENSGVYTIAANDVIGAISVSVTKTVKVPVVKEYAVTIYQNGTQTSTETAKEGASYTKTATDGYKIYKVTMNDTESSEFTAQSVSIGSVTGSIQVYMGKIYNVTLPEDQTVTGEEQANYGTDYRFTVQDGYEPNVTIGGKKVQATDNGDGIYTITGEDITGEIVIASDKIVYTSSVNVYDYVKANDGTLIQLVIASVKEGSLSDGEILQYNSQNMYWSAQYNGYAYLVAVAVNEDKVTSETASAQIGKAQATATTINYAGDVNMSGKVDINDAQLAYDIYKAKYTDFSRVSMEKMLRADMNADHQITVSDSAAIAAIVNK